MPKRVSMRGMGADAFFDAPVSQQTGKPVNQPNGIPAEQQASTPAVQLVKATFYLTPEHILRLERLRLERREKGERVDKSALVREAIDRL
jgi:hypothetical protein